MICIVHRLDDLKTDESFQKGLMTVSVLHRVHVFCAFVDGVCCNINECNSVELIKKTFYTKERLSTSLKFDKPRSQQFKAPIRFSRTQTRT